jgi:hypothetical protein
LTVLHFTSASQIGTEELNMLPNRLQTVSADRFNSTRAAAAAAVVAASSREAAKGYELRYRSLFNHGRGYAFPCNAAGHVDLDAIGERARINYFYARALVGRDFSMPAVHLSALH